jgi:hypothetical protein
MRAFIALGTMLIVIIEGGSCASTALTCTKKHFYFFLFDLIMGLRVF